MVTERNDRITVRSQPVPWAPGEHAAIIGTTGTGKTYLTSRLVEWRNYVAILRTKPDDVKFKGFKTVKEAKALESPNRNSKLLITPTFKRQKVVAAEVFDMVWQMGGWTIVIDELFYVHDVLGLKSFVDMLMTQGRSKRISVVVGMQRPVNVTRFALSEATHVFSFRLEGRDRKTVKDITSESFAEATGKVPPFHFAHYHVKTRSVGVGTAKYLERVLQPMAGDATLRDDGAAGSKTPEDRAST